MERRFRLLPTALLLLSVGLHAQIAASDRSKETVAAAKASLHAGVDRHLDASGYEILGRMNPKDVEFYKSWGFYPDRVLAQVRTKWYPLISQAEQASDNKRGTVLVEFTIKRDGSLGKIVVTESSQEKSLDAAALEGIKSAAPFQPLPAEYHQKSLALRFHFAYNQEPGPDRPVCGEPRRRARHDRGGYKPPRILSRPDPEYSEDARRSKFQGVVLIGATVEPSGEVSNVCVEQALGSGLDERAVGAVKTWRFQPATRDNQPVSDNLSIEVSFHLY
jgi:TonB family protein